MKKLFITFMVLFTSKTTFAHGENKLGPNAGYLKMPSTFHTELVPVDEKTFKVFLTDLQFKNAVTKDSKVEMHFEGDNKNISFICVPQSQFFKCNTNQKIPKVGKIIIKSTRLGKIANDAIYDFPLKLKGQSLESDPHAGHKMN